MILHPSTATPAGDRGGDLAFCDALTGLANRRRIEARLSQAVLEAQRSGRPVALLALDLNGFKRINDSLGHPMGDEVLVEVGRRLAGAARGGELLARLGGDEFVVLATELPAGGAGAAVAEGIAHRLADALRSPVSVGGVELLVEASVGVSLLPGDARTGDELTRHADAAMYAAKVSHRAVMVHGPDTPDPLAGLELAAQLRAGIERSELELHYQPIVRLADERVLGVEPLVRWRRPGHGLVMPDAFIEVAERTGVIEALGDWVLERACGQVAAWNAEGLRPGVGINVSPMQLRRPGFGARVRRVVADHGLDPGGVVLELTETAWSLEATRLLPALVELRSEGLTLAMDDFGAGYSSLARLRDLPVQIIKVDRGFLKGVPDDPAAVAIMAAILQLADACDCDVVAEGVETAAQLEFLRARGCRIGQGYLWARPQDEVATTALLRERMVAERRG